MIWQTLTWNPFDTERLERVPLAFLVTYPAKLYLPMLYLSQVSILPQPLNVIAGSPECSDRVQGTYAACQRMKHPKATSLAIDSYNSCEYILTVGSVLL